MSLLFLAACRASPTSVIPDIDGEVFIGAGDIAWCGGDGDERTAIVVDSLLRVYPDATVFTAGDNVYDEGTAQEYADCYQPSWGRFKERTWVTIGNREYRLGDADPTFDYFGSRAGPRGLGYYSFELGDWHVVMLNSNLIKVSAAMEAAQEQWLRDDLSANTRACVISVFHHPLLSSCSAGDAAEPEVCTLAEGFVQPFWDALYEFGAEIVVNGHRHWYERFVPLDPAGNPDPVRGIRQFIVGTGGRSVGLASLIHPMSEVRNDVRSAYGVLKLVLGENAYTWEFVPARGRTFTDRGSGVCTVTESVS